MLRSSAYSKSGRIATIYALVASLWIYFSDRALAFLISDPELLARWSLYKGFIFVAVTTVLLLWLISKAYRAVETGYTALQQHKHEIERFNLLYSALSHINQAIALSSSREVLLQKVCEALVRNGGFAMAWIGWRDAETGRLSSRAACGTGTEFIDRIIQNHSAGVSSAAFWEKVFVHKVPGVRNNLAAEPAVEGWRDYALSNKLNSWAIFPVLEKDQVVAVLSVHAGEADFFHASEIAVLEEAAADISFALNNFALATERAQVAAVARRESDFSQAMIESLPGIVYFYDTNGRFLRWNRNFETVSGYSRDEVAGMGPLEFFGDDERLLVQERIEAVFTSGESSVEAAFLCKDGTRIPYYFTGRAVMYDGSPCLVGVGIDISERKRAETALQDLNETLEARVVERTGELSAAVQRAEAADRLKSAFLATMSHELRTPLNSIIGFTGIVLQELAGPINAEQRKQLGMVRSSARHLLDVINDVLDLSKIEAGQLEVKAEPFDLRESVERVVALVSPYAQSKALALSTDITETLPRMTSDRRRVEQIMLNLLNNAIKFTDSGAVSVAVHVSRAQGAADAQGSGVVHVVVRDSGIGIRAEDLKKLFLPFSQIDTGLARQHEGTGLGLAICQRLAHLLGGEISVSSTWQVGSVFELQLPLTNELRQ